MGTILKPLMHFSVIIFMVASSLVGCTNDPDVVALPPSGLRYPGNLILKKNEAMERVVPTVETLNRHKPVYTVSVGSLPEGLRFDEETGAIEGTPTRSVESVAVTVTATTRGGSTSTELLISVSDLPANVSYPSSATCTMFAQTSGGVLPIVTYQPTGTTYNLQNSNQGISIDSSTGAISCNFQQWPGNGGVVNVGVNVSSPGNPPVVQNFPLQVVPVAPAFSYPSPLPSVLVGESIPAFVANQVHPLSSGILAQNGYSLQSCNVIRNGVPTSVPVSGINQYISGFSFNAGTGQISGVPTLSFYPNGTTTAAFSCTVVATGPSYGNNGGLTSAASFTLNVVAPAPKCSYASVNSIVSGSQTLDLSPQLDPTSGPVTSFALASPTSLQGIFNTATGRFFQNPFTVSSTGTLTPDVVATGPGGQAHCSPFFINVNPNITFSPNPWAGFKLPGTSYQASQISSGNAAYVNAFNVRSQAQNFTSGGFSSVSVTPSLPAGVSVNASTGAVSGATTNATIGSTLYTVKFSNSSTNFINVPLSLNVVQAPRIAYENPSYTFYVGQNNGARSVTIPKAASSTANLANFRITPSSSNVSVGTDGTITVSLDVAQSARAYTVCASYSSTFVSQNGLPSGIEDCTMVNLEVKQFAIAYPSSTYRLQWNQPLPAGIIPSVTNGPAQANSFSSTYLNVANSFPSGLGVFGIADGSISSNVTQPVVTALAGTYAVTVKAIGPNQSSASQTIQLIVDPITAPQIVYNNPNSWGTQGALNVSSNPWFVSNQGSASLSPTLVGSSPTPSGYELSGCAVSQLSAIGFSFNATNGQFVASGTNRALGEATCTVMPYLSAGSTRINGSAVSFKIKSSTPKIVVVGLFDSNATSANLVQGSQMSDADQSNYTVELDVGKVTLGAQPKSLFIKIKNAGEYPASQVQVNLSAPVSASSGSFAFSSGASSLSIPLLAMGATAWVEMKYAPKELGVNRGLVQISYLNGSAAVPSTPLALRGLGLKLFLSSATVDFGKTLKVMGTGIDRWVQLTNYGDTPLVYSARYNAVSGAGFKFADMVVEGQSFMAMGTPSSVCKQNQIGANTGCNIAILSNGDDHNVVSSGSLVITAPSASSSPDAMITSSVSSVAVRAVGELDPTFSTRCDCSLGSSQKFTALSVGTQAAMDSLSFGKSGQSPIAVCDVNDLNKMANALPGFYNSDGSLNRYVGWKGLNFRQCQDISGLSELVPQSLQIIGRVDSTANRYVPFLGTYDGSYREIRYTSINSTRTDFVGIFGKVGLGGKVTRVKMGYSRVLGNSAQSAAVLVGSMGDGDYNSLLNLTGTAEVSNNLVHSSVIGNSKVGGVVGEALHGSLLEGNTFVGFALGKTQSIGGLVGYIQPNASLNSVVIRNSQAVGLVAGAPDPLLSGVDMSGANADSVGGLIGRIQNPTGSAVVNGSVLLDNVYAGVYVVGGFRTEGGVGGLVGSMVNLGNGSANNFAIIQNSMAAGTVLGPVNLGGLVGVQGSQTSISNSKAYVNVIGNYNTYVYSASTPPQNFGGFVGKSGGTISRGLAFGDVKYWDSEKSSGASLASVNHVNMGGFAGLIEDGKVDTSVAYGNINGVKRIGGFVGLLMDPTLSSSVDGSSFPSSYVDRGSSRVQASASYGSVNRNSNGLDLVDVGGFVGRNLGAIHDSISFSSVTGTSFNSTGGFAGVQGGVSFASIAANSSVSIDNRGAYSPGRAYGLGVLRAGVGYYWGTGGVSGQFEGNPYKLVGASEIGINLTSVQLTSVSSIFTRSPASWTNVGTSSNLGFIIPASLPSLESTAP